MVQVKRTVVGVFMEREDAVREVQRLHNQGYKQSEVHIYSNPERARTVERLMGINVENVDVHHVDEDDSWWDTIKHSFKFYIYNADETDNRIRSLDNSNQKYLDPVTEEVVTDSMNLLEPYQKDLVQGKLVIAVDNYGSHNKR